VGSWGGGALRGWRAGVRLVCGDSELVWLCRGWNGAVAVGFGVRDWRGRHGGVLVRFWARVWLRRGWNGRVAVGLRVRD
jgi:hypothetical protein